jgi:hypothetical protein
MPSTAVEHISYDEATRELHVIFGGGESYTYYGVPRQVYASLRAAPSKGQFVDQFVKNRYDFRRRARSA